MAWQSMDTAPRDREILVRRMNNCGWEHYLVQRSTFVDAVYPWASEFNCYPDDRFDEWHEIPK